VIALTIALSTLLIVLVLRFGREGLARLAALPLRGGGLVALAGLSQLAGALTGGRRLELLLLSAALLAGFCWLNRRHAGVALAALGIGLNMAVMAANGGTMPVAPSTAAAIAELRGADPAAARAVALPKSHLRAEERTRLAFLSDRLLLPGPLGGLAAWSIGDALLLAGVGRLLWYGMKGPRRDRASGAPAAALPVP
jgi:hypothetical protein